MINTKNRRNICGILLSLLLVLALMPISSVAAMGAGVSQDSEPEIFYVEYLPGSHGIGYFIEEVEAGTLYTVREPEEAGIISSSDHADFLWWLDVDIPTVHDVRPGQQIIVDKNITLEAYWIRS